MEKVRNFFKHNKLFLSVLLFFAVSIIVSNIYDEPIMDLISDRLLKDERAKNMFSFAGELLAFALAILFVIFMTNAIRNTIKDYKEWKVLKKKNSESKK